MTNAILQHKWPSRFGGDSTFKLIFNDPMYNLGIKYDSDPTGDLLPEDEYFDWCDSTIKAQERLLIPGGTFWWLCPPAHLDKISAILKYVVGPRKYLIIKQETFAQYQRHKLTEDYRVLFCHQKPGGELTFNPDAIRTESARQAVYGDKRANTDGRVPGQVWNVRRMQGSCNDHVDWHNAQLPPELLDRIILGWTNVGDWVLDGFAGSGSGALAARRCRRNFVGVDASELYVTKIKERMAEPIPLISRLPLKRVGTPDNHTYYLKNGAAFHQNDLPQEVVTLYDNFLEAAVGGLTVTEIEEVLSKHYEK